MAILAYACYGLAAMSAWQAGKAFATRFTAMGIVATALAIMCVIVARLVLTQWA